MNLQISKKIAVIELQAHAEVFFHFVKLLNGTADLLLLTTTDIYQDAPINLVNNPNNQWVIKEKNQSDTAFLSNNLDSLNNCQHAIFITIVRDFRFYANLTLLAKKILIIHNSLAMLQPIRAIHLPFSWSPDYFLDILRVIKCFVFLEFWYKKKLVKNFDLLVFPTEIIEKFMINRVGYLKKMKTTHLDFSFYEPDLANQLEKPTNETIITIPGTISNEGRDYEMVIEAFKEIAPNFSNPVQLILAGRPKGKYGQQIIRQFQSLTNEFFQVVSFDHHISQLEYDGLLAKTHFLILPLKKHVKYSIYQEINGYTKITGSVNDMIRFGLLGLITEGYKLKNISINIERFISSEMLKRNILLWISLKKWEENYPDGINLNESNSSFETSQKKLMKILQELGFIQN